MPHEFDLTKALKAGRTHRLSLIFDQAPHEQGQIGFTSQSHIFKSRFNYGWDWVVRLVPLGIWDRLALRRVGPARLHGCLPDARYDVGTGQGEPVLPPGCGGPQHGGHGLPRRCPRRSGRVRRATYRRNTPLRLCSWPRRDPGLSGRRVGRAALVAQRPGRAETLRRDGRYRDSQRPGAR